MGTILYWLETISGAAGVLAGLTLILSSFGVRPAGRLSQCLLEADVITLLNKRRLIEKPIYRHHRLSGTVLIGATLLWIRLLTRLAARYELAPFMQAQFGPNSYRWLVFVCWSFIALALVIGAFLLIRPSAMKRFEAGANRWIEPFPTDYSPGKDLMVSHLVANAPRLAGLLLFAASIGCLIIAQ